MANESHNATPAHQRGPFDSFIQTLLTNAFAKSRHFHEESLDFIGNELESWKNQHALHPNDEEAQKEEKDFEICLNAYCQLLMEMDLMEFTWHPNETLHDILQRETRTFFHQKEQELVKQQEELLSGALTGSALQTDPRDDDPERTHDNIELDLDDTNATGNADPKSEEKDAILSQIATPEGRDYYRLAESFDPRALNPPAQLTPNQCAKLCAQGYLFFIQAELWHRFRPGLINFWPQRESALQSILANEKGKELRPELKEAFRQVAKGHADWLYQRKYPLSSVMNRFSHYLKLKGDSNYTPSLLELGAMLFFFGNEFHLGPIDLTNFLGADGLSQEELIEMAFRLSRLEKFSSKVLHPIQPFEPQDLTQLEEDVERIFSISLKMNFDAFPEEKTITHSLREVG